VLLLALDPGSAKCGLALVDGDGTVRDRCIVPRAGVVAAVTGYLAGCRPDAIVAGDGTTSRQVVEEIRGLVDDIPVVVVDEAGSTIEGREIWVAEGAAGIMTILPGWIRRLAAPEALDDWAAVALARRHLASHSRSST